ncbi:MAG: ABA4-like family protein [Pseudomonadota bacterium]
MPGTSIPVGLKRLYNIQGLFVQAGWLSLLFAVFWQQALIGAYVCVLAIGLVYISALAFGGRLDPESPAISVKSFFSLPGVIGLLQNRRAAFASWTHILVFDLLVGTLIVLDSNAADITGWLVMPCLFLTLMFGPAGFVAYVVLRLSIFGIPTFLMPW